MGSFESHVKSFTSGNRNGHQSVVDELSERDEKEKDLAFAYILKPVDSSCKAMIPQTRCPKTS